MTTPFWPAFAFSLGAALINLGGLVAIRRFEAWGRAHSILFAAFAAGVLIAAALLQLVPEALALGDDGAAFFLLGGYLAMMLLGRLSSEPDHTLHETRRAVALLPLIGIAIHSTIDGAAYAVAFAVDTTTGILAVLGLMLHEFPEGIVAYMLLLRGGFSPRTALLLAFVGAAASTPVGMALSWPHVAALEGALLGNIFALAAGVLLFVGATHLVPHVEHSAARGSNLAFFGGVAVSCLVFFLHRL